MRLALLLAGAALWAVQAAALEPSDLPPIQAGDLLFKGADTAFATELAAHWSTGDTRFGHVGIVVEADEGGVYVVHADTTGAVGAVRRVPLAEFVADVKTLGVYRLDFDAAQEAAFLDYTESVVGYPFDRGFSLDTPNNLYCTELVWRAMSAALGEDAVPEKSHRHGQVYVAVSDLTTHPLARELAVVTGEPAAARPNG